eukprot:394331_1
MPLGVSMKMNLCEYVRSNECSQFHSHESLYCCSFIQDYEDSFLILIRVCMWVDFICIMLPTIAVFSAIIAKIIKPSKDIGLYIMALSTFITAILTFLIVASLNQME